MVNLKGLLFHACGDLRLFQSLLRDLTDDHEHVMRCEYNSSHFWCHKINTSFCIANISLLYDIKILLLSEFIFIMWKVTKNASKQSLNSKNCFKRGPGRVSLFFVGICDVLKCAGLCSSMLGWMVRCLSSWRCFMWLVQTAELIVCLSSSTTETGIWALAPQ